MKQDIASPLCGRYPMTGKSTRCVGQIQYTTGPYYWTDMRVLCMKNAMILECKTRLAAASNRQELLLWSVARQNYPILSVISSFFLLLCKLPAYKPFPVSPSYQLIYFIWFNSYFCYMNGSDVSVKFPMQITNDYKPQAQLCGSSLILF